MEGVSADNERVPIPSLVLVVRGVGVAVGNGVGVGSGVAVASSGVNVGILTFIAVSLLPRAIDVKGAAEVGVMDGKRDWTFELWEAIVGTGTSQEGVA